MNKAHTDESLNALGKAVLKNESESVARLIDHIDAEFAASVRSILQCQGRVILTGMGKSGHIGGKIAATLASTGTPAFFVHPGEASHGDLGMITKQDLVIALSNSGETAEVLSLIPLLKRFGITLISMTGNPSSSLAKLADYHLSVAVEKEACPLGLAPTSSTTAALAMGDALAVTALECRGFTAEDFSLSHPGGSLGKRLLLTAGDLMHASTQVPTVTEHATVADAIHEMSLKHFGITAIVDATNHLVGVYTDGDIRRSIEQQIDVHRTRITEVMTPGGKTITPDTLAAEALNIMEQYKITSLFVSTEEKVIIGIIHMHDLLRAGLT